MLSYLFGPGESRFSNALPFAVKVQVFQDERRVQTFKTVTNHEWGISASVASEIYPGVKGDIKANYGGSYQSVEEGTVKYADSNQEGYLIIPPRSTQSWLESAYFTVPSST